MNGYLSHEPLPSATPAAVADLLGPLKNFDRDPASLTFPLGLGIPDWVFYGIVVPWFIASVLTLWYVFFFFAEDELAPDDVAGDANRVGPDSEAQV